MLSASMVSRLTVSMAAACAALTAAEALVARDVLQNGGLCSWPVASLRARWLARDPLNRFLSYVFSYPNVIILYFVRVAAALGLILSIWLMPASSLILIFLVILSFTSMSIPLRTPFGRDGAEQMTALIIISFTISKIHSTLLSERAFLVFVASQACLAYFVSGVAKAWIGSWRNGFYVAKILSTRAYGLDALGRYLTRRQGIAALASMFVIIFECSFPMVLVIPRASAFVLLGIGVLFHLCNAAVMGLNHFVFAFLATYPAILWLHEFLGLLAFG